jgi:hypothetical protein
MERPGPGVTVLKKAKTQYLKPHASKHKPAISQRSNSNQLITLALARLQALIR